MIASILSKHLEILFYNCSFDILNLLFLDIKIVLTWQYLRQKETKRDFSGKKILLSTMLSTECSEYQY